MQSRKAGLLIAAVIVAQQIGSPVAAAVPPDAIDRIQTMVQSGDADALRDYLDANPSLVESDSPLSRALNDFLEARGGILQYLGFRGGQDEALAELSDVVFQNGIY